MLSQPPLPEKYQQMSPEALADGVRRCKQQLGERLVILGHHYQVDEVVQFADFVGDSLKLSQLAAAQEKAEYIVFCGVHFMAESADVLSGPDQIVCLPNLRAGCAMAELAEDSAVATALEEMGKLTDAKVVPISYVNSTAAIKATTAAFGGACCTSGNVANVYRWALAPESEGGAGAEKIFAIPDQHLGRNTAVALGYSLGDCVVYDPALPDGGLTREQIDRATFLLWKGHCYVHQLFGVEDIENVRRVHPGIHVIVHPECPYEVVQAADAAGSTEQIIRAVAEADPGTPFAVGTESSLVDRLAHKYPDRLIRTLSNTPAICAQMKRIDLPCLLWVLENLMANDVVNRVQVHSDIAANARVALDRMISIRRVDSARTTDRQG